jgi:hypothetical protein
MVSNSSKSGHFHFNPATGAQTPPAPNFGGTGETESDEGGRRRGAHHQWLTDASDTPLAQHLHAVVTLMRMSRTWNQFKQMLDVAHPKRGDTLVVGADGRMEGAKSPEART